MFVPNHTFVCLSFATQVLSLGLMAVLATVVRVGVK